MAGKIHHVHDIRALRALAHPTRARLYELVTREGTLTTTRAAELTGESTAGCSFHLRQLAKYGFIEPAPSEGRARPWRRTAAVNRFAGLRDHPEFAAAAELAVAVIAEHHLEQLAEFLAGPLPPEWTDAAFVHDALLYLSAGELAELNAAVQDLTRRYAERTLHAEQRPADALPVALFASGFPLPPNTSGS
ncbi:MAG: winged helix-turn-helix domain-containing protein [Gaiellaceae bacterium]